MYLSAAIIPTPVAVLTLIVNIYVVRDEVEKVQDEVSGVNCI